jgi:hypothetical protein
MRALLIDPAAETITLVNLSVIRRYPHASLQAFLSHACAEAWRYANGDVLS